MTPGRDDGQPRYTVRFPRYLTAGSLAGLALGFALGAVGHARGGPAFEALSGLLGPLGGTWIDALLMVVIPLVISFLVLAAAGEGDPRAGTGRTARVGGLTLALMMTWLVAAALFALAVGPLVLSWMPSDPRVLEAARAAAVGMSAATVPAADGSLSPGEWIRALVPANPVRAAADGDILGVTVVSVVFGLAIGRIGAEGRRLVELFQGLRTASLVVTGWVLQLLPLAAFALAYEVAFASGVGIVGAVGFWIAAVSGVLVLFTLLVYPVTALAGGIPIRTFARGMWPSQTVAAGSRSSLATLPSLVRDAEERLGLPREVSGLALPLTVSTFKVNLLVSSPLMLLFLARLYGLELDPGFVVVFVGVQILLSLSHPGIPSGGIMAMLPFYVAAGIPAEAVVLLKTVDAIPDIFKTVLNVTADMSVTAVVARARRPSTTGDPDDTLVPATEAGLAR